MGKKDKVEIPVTLRIDEDRATKQNEGYFVDHWRPLIPRHLDISKQEDRTPGGYITEGHNPQIHLMQEGPNLVIFRKVLGSSL